MVARQSKYQGEESPFIANKIYGGHSPYGVEYFSATERLKYKMRFGSDGRVYDYRGKPIDTSNAILITREGKKIKTGRAIFVIDTEGNTYWSNLSETGQLHHTSFVSGAPVAFAGEIVIKNGYIKYFDNTSGHYLTPAKSAKEVLSYFKKLLGRGANLIRFRPSILN